MSVYADSSALVKLYADEADHQSIRAVPVIAVAQVARVEVPAAFWRKQRIGELAPGQAQILTAAFEADFFGTDHEPPRFAAVLTTGRILDVAARLCATHGLRAYDGIQLASARAARDVDDTCSTLAAFDKSLRAAASAEGFFLFPPE